MPATTLYGYTSYKNDVGTKKKMVLQRVACFGDVAVISQVSLTNQGIDENVCLDSIQVGR